MAKYRILVVDDEMSFNKKLFENLFSGDEDFLMETAQNWSDYCSKQLSQFDAILLDVNLDQWGKTLQDAFKVVDGACPIVLVSQYWTESRTHHHISEALASAKQVILAGTLTLNDIGRDGWEAHANSMRAQLRLVIARHRQLSLLDIKDDEPIRILHLSDPQYGDPSEDNLAFLVEKEIPRFILGELQLYIHFIAVTGDITYSGQPSEFITAEEKLKLLVEKFLPNREDWRDRLLIVPGNHDVDLRLAAADQIRYEFGCPPTISVETNSKDVSHQRFGLQAFRDFAWRLSGNPNWRDASELFWINDSFRHLGLRFYIFNSVVQVDSRNPKNYQIPVQSLNSIIKDYSLDKGLFGVVLAHHGPKALIMDSQEAIENWPLVLKTIQNTPIRLFIHGHGHARLADIVPLKSDKASRDALSRLESDELLRVMAPTTHLKGTKRPKEERRGFNLITLKRIHGKVEKVEVESYELSDGSPHPAKNSPWSVPVR